MLWKEEPRLCRWSALDQRHTPRGGPMQRARREGRVHTKASKSRQGTAAFAVWLDGESVLEFFYARLKILDLSLLLFHAQAFNPAQS